MSDIITVNDLVKVDHYNNKNIVAHHDDVDGVVRFIGEVPHEAGTFFGVHINPKFSGMANEVAYFKRNQLRLLEASSMIRVTVGDIVSVTKYACHGIVRFIGQTKFKGDAIWYGVQLEDAVGKNNGTIKGHTYFRCEPKYGIFVHQDQVELVKHKKLHNGHKHKKHSSHKRKHSGKKLTKSTSTSSTISEDSVHRDEPAQLQVVVSMPEQYKASLSTGVYGGYCIQFEITMPTDYKPSYSTGVYGGYSLVQQQQIAMPTQYKPSLSTGVYGGYSLVHHQEASHEAEANSDGPTLCKYVKAEDLVFWCNREVAPDLTEYDLMAKRNVSDDEIAEQMLKDEIPAYWINRFFVDGYVRYEESYMI